MNAAMYKALSGSMSQMRRLDVVAHNLANLNTVGFKRERLAFREVLGKSAQHEEDRMGGMVEVGEQRIDFSQGALRVTGNPFDLALDGEGFFAVETPRGERYTRQGLFTLSADRTVVTPLGDPLLGGNGPITLTGKDLEVTPDGAVLSDGKQVAVIRVIRFPDPNGMVKEGQSLYRGPEGEAEEAADFRVVQGSVEESNVNPIEGMVNLIAVQRQFQSYERAMRVMDSASERLMTIGSRI